MRLSFITSIVLGLLATTVASWEKEDHEIFKLRDDVIALEGANATFYSFVGVSPKATRDEINKAYRKKAARIHPDKAKARFVSSYGKPTAEQLKKGGAIKHKKPSDREVQNYYKEASERFSRLGVVAGILRGAQKDRYDYFLKNGFPKWRGTGYYYSRYRPGLGTVLGGLFIVMGGFAHYGAMYLGWKRQREFVERYIRHARRMAWGDETGIQGVGIPGVGRAFGSSSPAPATGFESATAGDDQAISWNRRQKRQAAKEDKKAGKAPKSAKAVKDAREKGISEPKGAEQTSGPQGAKKRVVAENGKVLIVDSVGNVYLEEENDDGEVNEYLLDPDEIPAPTIYDTVLFRLPAWSYNKTVGRVLNKSEKVVFEEEEEEEVSPEVDALNQAHAINANGETKKRKINGRT